MFNKRKRIEDMCYSKRHIRRIIRQQTLNDLNEIHNQIFSKNNYAESSLSNADTYNNAQVCDNNVQLTNLPNFLSPNDNVDQVDDLDFPKCVFYYLV